MTHFMKNLNKNLIAFTGGGTGGHIYPGLAVADEVKSISSKEGNSLQIIWIGCSKGMDKKIVETALGSDGEKICGRFYGISSGKLRRYFSLKNFTDLFRICFGFFSALHILKKNRPAVLFSKGGFVSVPPCVAAHLLHIPVFIHECDFTLGLANRINLKFATKMLVSYEDTKKSLSEEIQKKVIVTGNPVRPVFYNASAEKGLEFLGLKEKKSENELKNPDDKNSKKNEKPVLVVLGGSSGARQINELVQNNIDFLCTNFTVVHQTGLVNSDSDISSKLHEKYKNSYFPYDFIYSQMCDVIACSDLILSRAGANSLWEAAVLAKPMILVPLCGSGTRGDQVDNAKFFESRGAAKVLVGKDATSENLIESLNSFLDENVRKNYADNLKAITGGEIRPSRKIADLLLESVR